ncbi:MAG: TonB-dependent receptor [Geminicoccaceae bacterium]|nr:TonB-dependent receptor [Geminicoccaceae bacterium]
MVRAARGVLLLVLAAVPLGVFASDCPPERPLAGHLVAVEGEATRNGRAVSGPEPLCAGDELVVGAPARATVRLEDADTVLRLASGARLVVEAPPEAGSGRVRLLEGLLYFLSHVRRRLHVETPYVTAGIEGTEVLLEVSPRAAELAVLDGRVRLSGPVPTALPEALTTGEEARVAADGSVARRGAPAPAGVPIRARLRDRLGWTLFYPTVIEAEAERYPALRAAAELLARGAVAEAEARLATLAAEGEAAGLAAALQAVIALARTERDAAAEAARRAAALAPEAAGPRLAWSYVRQAEGAIDEALEEARIAARLAPKSAFVRARLAELALMRGDLAGARREGEASLALARTALGEIVLGHVELARGRPDRALSRFDAAVALAPADPAAHLGRALALVRASRLEEAGDAFATATALDPAGGVLRAYLARFLLEEGRDAKANEQLAVARGLVPDDPTPWLFAALLEQRADRPAAAARALEEAIARNRGRAPFRSALLLERDRATLGVALARIYQDLGREREAERAARDGIARDPGNAAAHRFLSDLLADRPRHEVARTSEHLQALLTGPLEAEPVSPRLGFGDLSFFPSGANLFPGYGEYAAAFERERIRALVTGIAGGSGTRAGEALLGALSGPVALSAGLLSSRTEGFRDNARIDNDLFDLLARFQLDERLQLQFQGRLRDTIRGDIAQRFDPDAFEPGFETRLRQRAGRIGAAFRARPESLLLGSLLFLDQREDFERDGLRTTTQDSRGYSGEVQWQERVGNTRLLVGAGLSRVSLATEFFGSVERDARRTYNFYVYGVSELREELRLTLGLEFDGYRNFRHEERVANPKFGLEWRFLEGATLRLAALRSLKRPLIVDQTLAPTQVAGFTQLFDDLNGSEAWLFGVGLDLALAPGAAAGLQGTLRRLSVPGTPNVGPVFDDHREWRLEGWLAWQLTPELALSFEPSVERFEALDRELFGLGGSRFPARVDTLLVPLRLRAVLPSGLFGELELGFVYQEVEDYRPLGFRVLDRADSSFFLLDAALGYRFPEGRGSLAIVATNMLDAQFRYLDDNFRTNQTRLAPFVPEATVLVRGSLRF